MDYISLVPAMTFDPYLESSGSSEGERWGYVRTRPEASMFWWLYHSIHPDGYVNRPLVLWLQVGHMEICSHRTKMSPIWSFIIKWRKWILSMYIPLHDYGIWMTDLYSCMLSRFAIMQFPKVVVSRNRCLPYQKNKQGLARIVPVPDLRYVFLTMEWLHYTYT